MPGKRKWLLLACSALALGVSIVGAPSATALPPGWAVAQSDYGTTEQPSIWKGIADAWAYDDVNPPVNDSQVLWRASGGDPLGPFSDPASPGPAHRTLRTRSTRVNGAQPLGSTLTVDSTALFPTSHHWQTDAPINGGHLLVRYGNYTNGTQLDYTGISGNTFTGVTRDPNCIPNPSCHEALATIPDNALVVAQSVYDAHKNPRDQWSRTQLVRNSCNFPGSTFYCYFNNTRSLTTFSVRVNSPSPIGDGDDWSGGACQSSQVAQIKQLASDGGGAPVFQIIQSDSMIGIRYDDHDDDPGAEPLDDYKIPKPVGGGWMRFALDVRFSTNKTVGKYQLYADLDDNGTYETVKPVRTTRTLLNPGAPHACCAVVLRSIRSGLRAWLDQRLRQLGDHHAPAERSLARALVEPKTRSGFRAMGATGLESVASSHSQTIEFASACER